MTALLFALAAAPLAFSIARDVVAEVRRRRDVARSAADLAIINALWAAEVDDLTPAQWEAWFRA